MTPSLHMDDGPPDAPDATSTTSDNTSTSERLPLRHAELGDGRFLEIRQMGPADVDGLVALYGGLSHEDRRRRFFSALRPTRQFLDRWARVAERGGFGLVAVVRDDEGAEEIVADAGYAPIPDGNAELAMTVGAEWRGWLGPYLLDALVEQAAAHGVATLEAEVLSDNGPMLALLRARGAAYASRPDLTSLRLLIGTAQRTPSWPPQHDRPRLLVEGAGTRWAGEEAASQAGYEVITCPGPGKNLRRCPLLASGSCPLVNEADAIMVVVRPGPDALGRKLIERMTPSPPTAEVVVEIERPTEAPVATPAGARLFHGCTPSAALLAALDDALGRSAPRGDSL